MSEARQPVREALSIGRDTIKSTLSLEASVVAGGAVTPRVTVYGNYDKREGVAHIADYRSGSRRSGSLLFKLEADRLYDIYSARNSSSGWTSLISTFDGVTKELNTEEFEEELRRRFPSGCELAQVKAEQRRIAEEAHQQAELVRERERLEQMKARQAQLAAEAEKIVAEGQPTSELPVLSGSPKQIAWALRIRDAIAARDPKHTSLRRATTASFWIENHRHALPRI